MKTSPKKKIPIGLLWLLPFFCFFFTYIGLHIHFKKPAFSLPNMTGCDLMQAAKICSALKLRLEIIESKEDAELPDGTIIKQIPSEGSRVKERQTIFVVITHKPAPPLAPILIGLPREEIDAQCALHDLKPIYYSLSYPYPTDYCFCQYPAAQAPLPGKSIICYIAAQEEHHAFWPSFIGSGLKETMQELDQTGIKVNIHLVPKPGRHYIITEQQPKAGALFDLEQIHTLQVDFKIEANK